MSRSILAVLTLLLVPARGRSGAELEAAPAPEALASSAPIGLLDPKQDAALAARSVSEEPGPGGRVPVVAPLDEGSLSGILLDAETRKPIGAGRIEVSSQVSFCHFEEDMVACGYTIELFDEQTTGPEGRFRLHLAGARAQRDGACRGLRILPGVARAWSCGSRTRSS